MRNRFLKDYNSKAKTKSYIDKNYGHDNVDRDYRKYSCIDNLIYLIRKYEFEDVGTDTLYCQQPATD